MRRPWLAGLIAVAELSAQDTLTKRDTALLAPTIVTVTRTPLELSRAPFGVSVVHRADIQRGKPGLALDEALVGIAGVQVDNRFNYALGERISIRGFGARAQFGVRGVRVLLDDIPMTLADGQTTLNNVDVANIARAEVIRGPASALHGNAAGGVIQLETDVTKDITVRASGGEARTTVGHDGLRRFQTTLGGASGPTAYSLALSRLTFDGYRQWNDARNDHASARVTRTSAGRKVAVAANYVDYDGKNPGGLSRALLQANRDTAFANNTRFKTGERGTQGQIGVTWGQRLGGTDLQMSAHGVRREIDNPIPQRIVVIDRSAGGARVALSVAPILAGRDSRLSLGAELQHQRDDRRNYVSNNGARGVDTLNQLERVTNGALFVQGSMDLAPRLLVLLGVRHDRIRFRAEDRLIGAGNPDDSGERTMTSVSPSVGLSVRVSPRLDWYSNMSTSFETPTTSELANQESGAGGLNPTLAPQRTRSAETGLNARVRAVGVVGTYQLSVYQARVRDALVPFEVASVPGRQYFRNAGSTEHRGIETAVSLVLPAHLSLRASFTHTDARFDRYSVTSGTTTTVYDGKRVPGVAANRADATLSFQPRRLFVDLEARASSSTPVNDANLERSPSHVVFAGRTGLHGLRAGAVEFAPYVGILNLFDRDHNTSVVVNAFGGRFYEPGPPRSVYLGATMSF